MHGTFDLICSVSVSDLEQPATLEEVNVVEQVHVQGSDPEDTVAVAFTPPLHTAARPPLLACPSQSSFCDPYPSFSQWTYALHRGFVPWSSRCASDKNWVAATLENIHLRGGL